MDGLTKLYNLGLRSTEYSNFWYHRLLYIHCNYLRNTLICVFFLRLSCGQQSNSKKTSNSWPVKQPVTPIAFTQRLEFLATGSAWK